MSTKPHLHKKEALAAADKFRKIIEKKFQSSDEKVLREAMAHVSSNIQAVVTEHPFTINGEDEFKAILETHPHFGKDCDCDLAISLHDTKVELHHDVVATLIASFTIRGANAHGVTYSRYGRVTMTFVSDAQGNPALVQIHTSPLHEGLTFLDQTCRAIASLSSLSNAITNHQ